MSDWIQVQDGSLVTKGDDDAHHYLRVHCRSVHRVLVTYIRVVYEVSAGEHPGCGEEQVIAHHGDRHGCESAMYVELA
jgi:hypothetical protein